MLSYVIISGGNNPLKSTCPLSKARTSVSTAVLSLKERLISNFGDCLLVGTGELDEWYLLISLIAPQRSPVQDHTAYDSSDAHDTLDIRLL